MFTLVKKVATSAKPAARRAPAQSRLMSGHAPPPAEGSFEAKVRAVLPEDYQIVLATLGAYTSLILFFKLLPSSKKDEIVIPASSGSASSAIPSLFDDEFDAWSQLPGNLERWENSLDTIGN